MEDLGSTNGTFVNDSRIQRQPLADGDQLRIGDVIYKFLVGANVEAAYHEEIYRLAILDGLTGVHNKRTSSSSWSASWLRPSGMGIRSRWSCSISTTSSAQRHSRASRRRPRPEDAVLPDPAADAA